MDSICINSLLIYFLRMFIEDFLVIIFLLLGFYNVYLFIIISFYIVVVLILNVIILYFLFNILNCLIVFIDV